MVALEEGHGRPRQNSMSFFTEIKLKETRFCFIITTFGILIKKIIDEHVRVSNNTNPLPPYPTLLI